MPHNTDDPREFKHESLRACWLDLELQEGRRRVEVLKAQKSGTSKIAEYFTGIPADLLSGLPETIRSMSGELGEDAGALLAGAQQALEMRDSEGDS